MPKNAASKGYAGVPREYRRTERTQLVHRHAFRPRLDGPPDGSIDLLNRGWQHGWYAVIRHPG